MALSWACYDLKIPSVDIQHGQQGKYHGMYHYWTKIPKFGYHIMPSFFGLGVINGVVKLTNPLLISRTSTWQ